jgi:Rrf2 family transcriptional regulator, nitric oxide-sensitive transcriptional repressor
MQLTKYTDYSLRVLIHLAAHPERLATIPEVSAAYGISRNHLMKVVLNLARHGFIRTQQGKNGGMRLARPAIEINIGDVVRAMEASFDLVECFNMASNTCVLADDCGIKGMLRQANHAFLAILDRFTLADAVVSSSVHPLPPQRPPVPTGRPGAAPAAVYAGSGAADADLP